MNERNHPRLAALNAVWQRYARTAGEPRDPETVEELKRRYLEAWEGLDACGIAEWMLVYDLTTLTFSLPTTGGLVHDAFATMPLSAVPYRTVGNRGRQNE
jgi:hypothetical protein